MNFLLIFTLAIMVGLVVLFFMLGLGKVLSKKDESENFHNLISALNESEIALDRQDANLPNRKTWTGYWADLAIKAGSKPNNMSTPGLMVVGVAFFAFLAGWFVWPRDVIGGLAFAAVAIFIIRTFYQTKIRARLTLMNKQLPNLLSGIRANLAANLTPQQAIVNQAKELSAPLGDEVRVLVEEMQIGVTLDSALRNLGQRVPSREIQFLVSAFRIAIKSGADLDPLVKTIQDIVVQRQRISNALATAVAKVQPSIWVAGLMIPLAFAWSFYSSPENQSFWVSFPMGIIILGICAVFYAVGLIIARKLVDRIRKA